MRTRTIAVFRKFISIDYPLTIDTLSEEFQISTRTMRNEIREINDFLHKRALPLISSIRNKGFIIKGTNEQKQLVKIALQQLPVSPILSKEERQFDLLLAIAFSVTPIILSQKENSYYVSKSVLDEDIRKLKLRLKKYEIGRAHV